MLATGTELGKKEKKKNQPWNDFARFSVFPHEEPLWVSRERSLLLSNKKGESLIQRQPNSRELFYQLQRTLDETQRRICSWASRGCHWCWLRGSWWLSVGAKGAALNKNSLFSWHGWWGFKGQRLSRRTGQSPAAVRTVKQGQSCRKIKDMLSKQHRTRTHMGPRQQRTCEENFAEERWGREISAWILLLAALPPFPQQKFVLPSWQKRSLRAEGSERCRRCFWLFCRAQFCHKRGTGGSCCLLGFSKKDPEPHWHISPTHDFSAHCKLSAHCTLSEQFKTHEH